MGTLQVRRDGRRSAGRSLFAGDEKRDLTPHEKFAARLVKLAIWEETGPKPSIQNRSWLECEGWFWAQLLTGIGRDEFFERIEEIRRERMDRALHLNGEEHPTIERKQRGPKNVQAQIHVRVEDDMLMIIGLLAVKSGSTVSDVVRGLLRKALTDAGLLLATPEAIENFGGNDEKELI